MSVPWVRRKYCSACLTWKELDHFYPRRRADRFDMTDPTKRRGPCKDCYRAIYNNDYRKSLKARPA